MKFIITLNSPAFEDVRTWTFKSIDEALSHLVCKRPIYRDKVVVRGYTESGLCVLSLTGTAFFTNYAIYKKQVEKAKV